MKQMPATTPHLPIDEPRRPRCTSRASAAHGTTRQQPVRTPRTLVTAANRHSIEDISRRGLLVTPFAAAIVAACGSNDDGEEAAAPPPASRAR